MATSRDDFIIAIRSAFLKKTNKQRFSLTGLIVFSLILIFLSRIDFLGIKYLKSGLSEVIYRVSFVVSLPEKQLSKGLIALNSHFKLYEDYEFLKKQNKILMGKNYNNKYLISENRRLKELIDDYIINSEELVAKVLLDKDSPFLKSLILNKGTKDNIKIGMAVLDGPYLIGKIVEVNYKTSRVLLISDLNSKIPVILEPGNIQSILSGTGKEHGEIQYFKNENELEENMLVFTSGAGGIFKSGIPIGNIRFNELTSNFEKVNFFSDLSQLTFVKIINFNLESN